MTGEELLNLNTIRIFALPAGQKRIETKKKKEEEEEIKLVSNFEPYAAPEVTKLVRTLGNIAKPNDRCETSVAYLGNNAILADLKTWRQLWGTIRRNANQAISFARGRNKAPQIRRLS